MIKACIFDMDGVIINSESVWQIYEKSFVTGLFGTDISEKLQDIAYGGSIQTIYDQARKHGFSMEYAEYRRRYNEQASVIYKEARITDGIDQVLNYLRSTSIRVGLVTASPKYWIDMTLTKFNGHNTFDCIVSIDEERLTPKPDPAGYRYALRELGVTPEETVVLEDSNIGIAAAKAAGIYTIGLRQHMPHTYVSDDADRYIDQIREIIPLLQKGTL